MGAWYTIGILFGVGTALGIAVVGISARLVVGAVVGAVIAVGFGLLVWGWGEAVGGAVGAVCGASGASPIVSGALRRGGTRVGTASLLCAVSLVVAALAFIPVVGYLEAIAAALLGLRVRRRTPDRHAGLRSLARD
jgi:hypothetical protein